MTQFLLLLQSKTELDYAPEQLQQRLDAYREWLKSEIADLNNTHGNAYAGASVAGLFLDRFVGDDIDWAHFDTFAWRPFAKPGRPKGGAAYGLRASYHMLCDRYPTK